MKTKVALPQIALLAGMFVLIPIVLQTEAKESAVDKENVPVHAIVYYRDQMIIVSHEKGVSAFVFKEKRDNGVNYQFRSYSIASKKESSGAGSVFEKWKKDEKKGRLNGDPNILFDDGGQMYLKDNSVSLRWAISNSESGWIIYEPEKMRVSIAAANAFEKIDLKRFIWK